MILKFNFKTKKKFKCISLVGIEKYSVDRMTFIESVEIFSTFILALVYLSLLSLSFFCFLFTLNDIYKFQFNLFLTLTLTAFSRFTQNVLIFLTDLLYVKNVFIFELQAFIDNFGIFFGFCVYMTLVLFWAEQYYKRKNKEINTRTIHVVFYIIIALFLFILVTIGIFFFAIDEFHPNSLIYRLIRLLMRVISTICIVFGLLFYGLNLYVSIKQSSSKSDSESKKIYRKIGSITLFCTIIYFVFLFYNSFTFILGEYWIYFQFKFFFKFMFSLFESLGFVLLIFICRPKNFLDCCEKYNEPIVFDSESTDFNTPSSFLYESTESIDYVE